MKIISFRAEVLHMHFLVVLCLFLLLVPYRRGVKCRFWLSLQVCCLSLLLCVFLLLGYTGESSVIKYLKVLISYVLVCYHENKRHFFQISTGLVFGMAIQSPSSSSCSFTGTRIWDQLSLYWGFLCRITWWFLVWSQRWEDLPSLIDFIGGLHS